MLWDNIRTFYLLVKTQNIKLVASILNIHYSTIVRRIEALEKIFNINLFTNRKKIILTEFGEILFNFIYKSCKNFEYLNTLNTNNIQTIQIKEKFNIYITDIYYYNILNHLYKDKILCNHFFNVSLISITNDIFIKNLIHGNYKNFLFITHEQIDYLSINYINLPIYHIPIFLHKTNNNYFIKYNGKENWLNNLYNIYEVQKLIENKNIIYTDSIEVITKVVNCNVNGIIPNTIHNTSHNCKKIKDQKLFLIFHEDNTFIQKFFSFENIIL